MPYVCLVRGRNKVLLGGPGTLVGTLIRLRLHLVASHAPRLQRTAAHSPLLAYIACKPLQKINMKRKSKTGFEDGDESPLRG
jgi:hypothetical protein